MCVQCVFLLSTSFSPKATTFCSNIFFLVTFNFSIVFDPLVVELSSLLQIFANHSFNFFRWNWSHDILHQNLNEKANIQPRYINYIIIVISLLYGDFGVSTNPLQQRQSGFQRTLWTTKGEKISARQDQMFNERTKSMCRYCSIAERLVTWNVQCGSPKWRATFL